MVVAAGVEGEFADEVAGFGEDADVAVVGEDQDSLAGVSSAESDVVQAAVVAQGGSAAGADAVLADAVVAVGDGDPGGNSAGAGGVGVEWSSSAIAAMPLRLLSRRGQRQRKERTLRTKYPIKLWPYGQPCGRAEPLGTSRVSG